MAKTNNEKEQWYVVGNCGTAIKFNSNEELKIQITAHLPDIDIYPGMNVKYAIELQDIPKFLRWAMDNGHIKTYGVWR